MEFILRIFFSGLIAFVPSTDGKELTVLLVNAPHGYEMADGSTLAHHKPLLLARAAHCEGTCTTGDHAGIAKFMFSSKTEQQAVTALNGALQGGGAWQLADSELSFGGAEGPLTLLTGVRTRTENGTLQLVPATPAEREDFTWVTDLSELAPGTEGFQSALTGGTPGNLVAARLKLRSGKVMTYSLVKIDGKARPVHFRKPSGEAPEAPYAQAVANWVRADIAIKGDFVEVVEQGFGDPARRRAMKLRPIDGKGVELALVNFPPFAAPAADAEAPSPQPGQHFQVFYELVKTPPALAERLVPHQALSPSASDPQVDWASLHPRDVMWSDLLEQLGMSPRAKTPYELALCPMVRE